MDLTNRSYIKYISTASEEKLCKQVRAAMITDIAHRYFKRTDKILDMGTGSGEWIIPLMRMGYRNISATDADDYAKDALKKKGVDFRKAYLGKENLPWQNKEFDVVMSFHLLEHLTDPETYFTEARRVLKEDGLLITVIPDWRRRYKTFYSDPTHVHPYDKQSIRKTYEFFGFKVIECRNFEIMSPFGITRLWKVFKSLLYSGDALICIGKCYAESSK